MQQKLTANKRIESIDIIRGIAMVIMALDHTKDCFHITANIDDPLNLATTTPFLYFTRWITNLCTPTFVFLAGTSAWLQSRRKTTKELSKFLIPRKQLFAAGSVYISTDQPLEDLAIVPLEPTSKDSHFSWGFFLSIFQRTEYMEAFVIEPMAKKMPEDSLALQKESEVKKAQDKAFANDPNAILTRLYSRINCYDDRYLLCPPEREL